MARLFASVAPEVKTISRAAAPIASLLGASTNLLIRLLPLRRERAVEEQAKGFLAVEEHVLVNEDACEFCLECTTRTGSFCCAMRCSSSATQPLPRGMPYSADRLSPTTSSTGPLPPSAAGAAHGEAADKLKAFAAGGVNYVTKPFQVYEVLARIPEFERDITGLPMIEKMAEALFGPSR